jgi:hypothetical protein
MKVEDIEKKNNQRKIKEWYAMILTKKKRKRKEKERKSRKYTDIS